MIGEPIDNIPGAAMRVREIVVRGDCGAEQVSAGNSPDRRTEVDHTEVVIFAVYGDWLAVEPLLPATVAEINRSFRPGDPSVCMGRLRSPFCPAHLHRRRS